MKIQEEAELTPTEDICVTFLLSSGYFRNPVLWVSNSPWSSVLYNYSPPKKDQILNAVWEIFPVCHAMLLLKNKI